MSTSPRQRSPRDPLPPQMPAPRARYNRRQRSVRQREDKRLYSRPRRNPSKTLQEPSVPTSAEVYTLVSPLASPLTPISSDLTRLERMRTRGLSPRKSSNHPMVHHHFLLPHSDTVVMSIVKLWDHLRIPFPEQQYATRSLIANEFLIIPYFKRLRALTTLLHAYNYCNKARAELLDRFRANLYDCSPRDSVVLDILRLRELTIFMVSLDNKAGTVVGRPISLAEISSKRGLNLEGFFFDECIFTEETVAMMMLATQFIRTMNLIQLQTLINIFFDKCISWYTPMNSLRDELTEYEDKARKIISLYFLLGLVADARFEGNILPALFIAHLNSIKGADIAAFRNELLALCDDGESLSPLTNKYHQIHVNIPLQPLFGLADHNASSSSSIKKVYAEQKQAPNNSFVNKVVTGNIMLTPSEAFHAILTNGFLKEISDEFLLFCKEMGHRLPLISAEPKNALVEVYRVTHSGQSTDTSDKSLNDPAIGVSVPSPLGVESLWINGPSYTEFSIDNAHDRSIEGTTGLNPVQLLGEEEYDLLGILNWPRVHVTPFLVEGASKLMKRLIANNIERRSKSLPVRDSKQVKPQKKRSPHDTKKVSSQHPQPPPPPPLVSTTVPPGSSKSVPLRPKFTRKVIISNALHDQSDIRAHQISKPDLTLEDLTDEPMNYVSNSEIREEVYEHNHNSNSEVDVHGQSVDDTELVLSADLTAIFLGHSSQTEESP